MLFKEIVEIMYAKNHLTLQGFQRVISIKASLNKGLSEMVKSEFKNVVPIARPLINIEKISDLN
jgi:hypothetical protein